MKFFVPNYIYEERIAICKACEYYFSLTGSCKVCGCFMKVKSRLAPMGCPKGYWEKTTEIETPDEIPTEIIEAVKNVWPDIRTGKAKDVSVKKRMIELYNTIHGTSYSYGTNCGSCLNSCFQGLKRIYNKYK
tara:strand:+ start:313 stop:708 length:396 start_codon:yes stop_codon:yes gene_type:complete